MIISTSYLIEIPPTTISIGADKTKRTVTEKVPALLSLFWSQKGKIGRGRNCCLCFHLHRFLLNKWQFRNTWSTMNKRICHLGSVISRRYQRHCDFRSFLTLSFFLVQDERTFVEEKPYQIKTRREKKATKLFFSGALYSLSTSVGPMACS